MCIAIVTTEHPQYPFILLSNRDEYLHRPTAEAQWWDPPNSHILGGFDLLRVAHGTWLGVTRQGRIAVLTNYREEGEAVIEGARSRGEIPNTFLKISPDCTETTEESAHRIMDAGIHGVGGFSLIFGKLQDVVKRDGNRKGLALISNRTPDVKGLVWLARSEGETVALSNSHYGDMTWPKVLDSEKALKEAVSEHVTEGESQDHLFERLFEILSVDTMPPRQNGQEWEVYLRQLRKSIFIPAIGKSKSGGQIPGDTAEIRKLNHMDATTGVYGTQKQTIIMVDREGNLTYKERTLFDPNGNPIEKGKADRIFEFKIEGW